MSLSVDIASFKYDSKAVLRNVRFELENGNHLAVLGESGCGKSTLLHLIYGLLHLEEGSIKWNGEQLRGPNYKLIPGEGFIKLVAQEFRLTAFTTVAENVREYLSGNDPEQEASRVDELLELVELVDVKHRKVELLSGGQKQRVALVRALARRPSVLLLDEPFSHIDTFRKNRLRRELYGFLKRMGISCITATHDAEEALSYADSILVLKEGDQLACASPRQLYTNPRSAYIAGFFDAISTIPPGLFNNEQALFLYPHQLEISDEPTGLQVKISDSYFKGREYLIRAKSDLGWFYFYHPRALEEGLSLYLRPKGREEC